jgi:hypothetical protein
MQNCNTIENVGEFGAFPLPCAEFAIPGTCGRNNQVT